MPFHSINRHYNQDSIANKRIAHFTLKKNILNNFSLSKKGLICLHDIKLNAIIRRHHRMAQLSSSILF